MLQWHKDHGIEIVCSRSKTRRSAPVRQVWLGIIPAGEQIGEADDRRLRVGGNKTRV